MLTLEHSGSTGGDPAKLRGGRRLRKDSAALFHDPFQCAQNVLWPTQERSGEGLLHGRPCAHFRGPRDKRAEVLLSQASVRTKASGKLWAYPLSSFPEFLGQGLSAERRRGESWWAERRESCRSLRGELDLSGLVRGGLQNSAAGNVGGGVELVTEQVHWVAAHGQRQVPPLCGKAGRGSSGGKWVGREVSVGRTAGCAGTLRPLLSTRKPVNPLQTARVSP